ncbi:MAG: hypothetical protein ABSH52_32185 [Terriglobia bacterium]
MKAHEPWAPGSRFRQTGRHVPGKRERRTGQILAMAALTALACAHLTYAASITSPIQVAYQFVHDSSGTHPGPTSKILLGFNQGDEAYLYAVSAKHSLAYHGRWSYANGQMSLSFGAADFKVDARFALRLTDEQVTMPFQVLSSGAGQSYWQMSSLPIESGIYAVYGAARADEALGISAKEAVKRAFAYAQSRVQLEASGPRAAVTGTGGGNLFGWASQLYSGIFSVAYASAPCQSGDPNEVKQVDVEAGGVIRIQYCQGPDEWIYLGNVYPVGTDSALHTATLTNDPRVHLDPQSPGDPSSDPSSKTALIIAPYTEPAAGSTTDGYQDVNAGTGWINSQQDIVNAKNYLSNQNYSITTLVNQQATVQAIVTKLSGLQNPGFLDWEGHGVPVDVLLTYEHSAAIPGSMAVHTVLSSWYDGYLNQLKSTGLGDLVTYNSPPSGSTTKSQALRLIVTDVNGNPQMVRGYIALTPDFWNWMVQKRGLALHRSLALMNACDSAETPALAQALQAGAFFGWNYESAFNLSLAVQKYLLESLSRPTHSTEESYYNMYRVAKTRTMIYKEDKALDGAVGVFSGPAEDTSDLIQDLRAYGWDGSKLIDYSKAGWTGAIQMNPGQIWWLLFAERWSHDRRIGADNVAKCYNDVWGGGDLGNAFKYMFCHNANTGQVPTRNEVAYAVYLLTGKDMLGFSGAKVPRWTLDDGR